MASCPAGLVNIPGHYCIHECMQVFFRAQLTIQQQTRQTDNHIMAIYSLYTYSTWVSQHQKGKPLGILMKQKVIGWQLHQVDQMHIICTSIQITMPTPHHSIHTGRMFYATTEQCNFCNSYLTHIPSSVISHDSKL